MAEDAKELDELFEQNIPALAEGLGKALGTALADWQAGENGELSRIYVSFLLSGVLCKRPWLQIELCGEGGGMGISRQPSEWDVPEISARLYSDAESKAIQQDERIADYDLEQLWLDMAEDYEQAFKRHMPEIIDKYSAAKTVDCEWYFGEYLGETTWVWGKTDALLPA